MDQDEKEKMKLKIDSLKFELSQIGDPKSDINTFMIGLLAILMTSIIALVTQGTITIFILLAEVIIFITLIFFYVIKYYLENKKKDKILKEIRELYKKL